MTEISCGCGDFSISVTEYDAINELDVICPKCDNHFGFGEARPDFPHQILDAADEVDQLAEEARTQDRDFVAEASLKLHAQQLSALALAYSSVTEDEAGIKFDWEDDE